MHCQMDTKHQKSVRLLLYYFGLYTCEGSSMSTHGIYKYESYTRFKSDFCKPFLAPCVPFNEATCFYTNICC